MSTAPDTDTTANNSKQTKRWRDVLPIHPAAELFPLMGEAELRELADDIKKHGLRDEVTLYLDPDRKNPPSVLEGRNRLDALELLGRETVSDHGGWPPGIYTFLPSHLDPFAYVISKNIHRRHLTPDQGRGLIAKVLKAKPKQSNRQIAKQVKADDKTVAKVRSKLEATAEIPQLTPSRCHRRQSSGNRHHIRQYSLREMAKAFNVSKMTARRALHKLQERGLIVQMKRGAFSLKERHATEWRLTEFGDDVTGALATKDFARWKNQADYPLNTLDGQPTAEPIDVRFRG